MNKHASRSDFLIPELNSRRFCSMQLIQSSHRYTTLKILFNIGLIMLLLLRSPTALDLTFFFYEMDYEITFLVKFACAWTDEHELRCVKVVEEGSNFFNFYMFVIMPIYTILPWRL